MNFTIKLEQNKKTYKQLTARLEIYFWALLVRLMSDSVLVQRMVQVAHTMRLDNRHVRFLFKSIALSVAGLLTGLVVGYLSAL